jgi:Putative zinc-finger
MTSPYPDPAGSLAWTGGHASKDLLARYAAGTVETVDVWSVEAHLTGCARCRLALSALADAGRLARNQSVLLVRLALPDGGHLRRLLRWCGIPDYLFDLVAATPSLRQSWLLSVVGVLAVVTGEAAVVRYGVIPVSGHPGLVRNPGPETLTPFLLIAPLLVLAGVAAAFLPTFDPGHRLAVAAPFSGVKLLLARTVSALIAALVPVACAALIVPGPGWLPGALLLPSLALSAFALAASTIVDSRTAAVSAGMLWATPALLLAAWHVPLAIVQQNAQFACAAVLCTCAVVLYLRRDRFEMGSAR